VSIRVVGTSIGPRAARHTHTIYICVASILISAEQETAHSGGNVSYDCRAVTVCNGSQCQGKASGACPPLGAKPKTVTALFAAADATPRKRRRKVTHGRSRGTRSCSSGARCGRLRRPETYRAGFMLTGGGCSGWFRGTSVRRGQGAGGFCHSAWLARTGAFRSGIR
jgi:hypothetical protein